MLSLALRGVSAQLLEPMQVEDRDLASTQTRATRITGMLPFFVMMAVLYGALNAALDTTAGERERGSLEPLLMNPTERWALVAGKWGAVACVSMLIAVLSCFSFLPGQWVLRSDTLAAMFQYGPREAVLFIVRAAAARGGARRGADGGGDPLPDVQGGAGERDDRRPGGLAAAAGQRLRSRAARRPGTSGCRRWRRTR